jgi:hypothetical protein
VTVPPANAPRESGFAALAAAADALGGRSSTDGHNAAAGRKSTDSQGALGRKSTDASAGLARSSSDVQTPRPPVTSTGPPTPSAIDPGVYLSASIASRILKRTSFFRTPRSTPEATCIAPSRVYDKYTWFWWPAGWFWPHRPFRTSCCECSGSNRTAYSCTQVHGRR